MRAASSAATRSRGVSSTRRCRAPTSGSVPASPSLPLKPSAAALPAVRRNVRRSTVLKARPAGGPASQPECVTNRNASACAGHRGTEPFRASSDRSSARSQEPSRSFMVMVPKSALEAPCRRLRDGPATNSSAVQPELGRETVRPGARRSLGVAEFQAADGRGGRFFESEVCEFTRRRDAVSEVATTCHPLIPEDRDVRRGGVHGLVAKPVDSCPARPLTEAERSAREPRSRLLGSETSDRAQSFSSFWRERRKRGRSRSP